MSAVLSRATATQGDTYEIVVVDGLTRTQIVQYAGASGDFNPLHTDEAYATSVAGYDLPVAHGMLTMGLTSRAVTEWVGDGCLTSFGVRFMAPVFPGDTLTTRMVIDAVEQQADDTVAVKLSVETKNATGIVVVRGHASATLAD
ncbi:MaoC family dehydratase [Rhodococcus sp. T2V]|uniref:MaoC family dehydratase n=1 Tax=Rhodococcus sp. T2V TaxID=3034164 RepID=UPI0023E21C5E|nr:MaoC family dehydratase [Rhodococcus sp. T2V]MDF3310058.1 MaoC family dehydratase [Rhodococcus sp. T2V]